MEKQHAAAVINGHGVINKEEGKRGDAYQRTITNGQRWWSYMFGHEEDSSGNFMRAVSGSAAADSSTQRDGLGDLLMAVDKLWPDEEQPSLFQHGNGNGNGNAERRGEKSNLLYEGFFKLGAPLTVVLVYFAQGVGTYYREKNSQHINQLAIWY